MITPLLRYIVLQLWTAMEEDELLKLGGNIELSGFNALDGGVIIVLKKIVGNYAKKMTDHSSGFEKLQLTMKIIHAKEKSEKYEVKARLRKGGNVLPAEHIDRNLFVAVDNSLKGIMSALDK